MIAQGAAQAGAPFVFPVQITAGVTRATRKGLLLDAWHVLATIGAFQRGMRRRDGGLLWKLRETSAGG